jgi:WD40 repeat protein
LSRQVFHTSGHQLYSWEAHKTTVTAMTFAPVWGSTLVTGGADGTLKLWNVLSIGRELETLGLSLRRPIPTLTVIVLAMVIVGYLIMIIGIFTMRLRPAFKRLPPKLFVKIGAPIMLTGMLLPMVVPGVYSWWDYSTPAYIQRMLCVVLGAPLFYLLFVKVLNRLSFMKKKRT